MFSKIIMISCRSQEEMEDAENAMEEEPSLSSSTVSEAELDRLAGILEELHHLLETAPNSMVQPPGKAFPTSARITGPQERDDPYPTLYRYTFKHTISNLTQCRSLYLKLNVVVAYSSVMMHFLLFKVYACVPFPGKHGSSVVSGGGGWPHRCHPSS